MSFSKMFIGSMKRTAQNVYPLMAQLEKKKAEINALMGKIRELEEDIDAYEAPIKSKTGGFSSTDLVERVIETTDKVDKDGRPIKITKWVLKYPETVVPEITPNSCAQDVCGSDFDVDKEASEHRVPAESDYPVEGPAEIAEPAPFNII